MPNITFWWSVTRDFSDWTQKIDDRISGPEFSGVGHFWGLLGSGVLPTFSSPLLSFSLSCPLVATTARLSFSSITISRYNFFTDPSYKLCESFQFNISFFNLRSWQSDANDAHFVWTFFYFSFISRMIDKTSFFVLHHAKSYKSQYKIIERVSFDRFWTCKQSFVLQGSSIASESVAFCIRWMYYNALKLKSTL